MLSIEDEYLVANRVYQSYTGESGKEKAEGWVCPHAMKK